MVREISIQFREIARLGFALGVAALLAGVLGSHARADDCDPPAALMKEVEGCGDHSNDGCNANNHPTEPIEFSVPIAGSFWSTYEVRDTDFYRFVLTQPTTIRVRAWSAQTLQLLIVDRCEVLGSDANTCAEAEACLPPGVFNIFVSPLDTLPDCGDSQSAYTVLLTIDQGAPACTPLVGDVDKDGVVGGSDLNMLLWRWESVDPGACDITGDGRVNGADLAGLLAHWTL